jgi:2-polyprenyl-3-methyl-5-hydroxy-6-metoxy-1,4-benzoquinol methylase
MDIQTEKTAIKRVKPSAPAKYVVNNILPIIKCKSILDLGCGFGGDLTYYSKHIKVVYGFDPAAKFGYSKIPKRKFDLVVCSYVLNVVPSMPERLDVLLNASKLIKRGGHLFVVSRSYSEIASLANKNLWKKYNDGYLTRSNTFQCGLSINTYESLAAKLGLEIISSGTFGISGATCVLLKKVI